MISENLGQKIQEYSISKIEIRRSILGESFPILHVINKQGQISPVKGFRWQQQPLWNSKTVLCEEVKGRTAADTWLKNVDFRHPLYQIGVEYLFEVVDEKIVETVDLPSFGIFIVKGEDGWEHEVKQLPGQTLAAMKNRKIPCRVLSVSNYLHLTQQNNIDPLFAEFRDIIADSDLEDLFFTPLFIDSLDSLDVRQFVDQYRLGSAFWIFTYTNKVLIRRFEEKLADGVTSEAQQLNFLIKIFESWIIDNGIIESLPTDNQQIAARTKATRALTTALIFEEIFQLGTSKTETEINDYPFLSSDQNLFEKYVYLIEYCPNHEIDYPSFIRRLEYAIANKLYSPSEVIFIKKLSRLAYAKKRELEGESETEYFSLTSVRLGEVQPSSSDMRYLSWCYIELLLSQALGNVERINILTGQILRLLVKVRELREEKQILLYAAFRYFVNYRTQREGIPFRLGYTISIDFNQLRSMVSINAEDVIEWEKIENNNVRKNVFTVKLVKREKGGYQANFHGLSGFLPLHNITDLNLKRYTFEECDFDIEVICTVVNRFFGTFIVKESQSPGSSSVKNNNNLITGRVYDAYVKRVDNGLFISTMVGDGLVRVSDIFDAADLIEITKHSIDIFQYFPVGLKIKVIYLDVQQNGRNFFSFNKLKIIDPEYYIKFVDNIILNRKAEDADKSLDSETDIVSVIASREQVFCIEQFAIIETDLKVKIQQFEIAKQLYVNLKNARSYLVNIFISYFNILAKIDEALKLRSLEKISAIKIGALKILESIDKRTIQTFPDSDKLFFFMQIVTLFNETSEDQHEKLYGFIKLYSEKPEHKDLKTVAKITLANNLIISESKGDTDFSIRNLRLIFDYLSHGLLSLDESAEDKNARQIRQDQIYWKSRIQEDEGELLEFKSSFFSPILDESAQRKLDLLSNLPKQTAQIIEDKSRINGELAKKRLIHSCFKTLGAFANSKGGTLLIGVSNSLEIVGIENEFIAFSSKKDQNRDGYGKFFDSKLREYFGDSFSALVTRKYLRFLEGDILIVEVQPSAHEIFLLKDEEGDEVEQLYIRNLSSSKELTGSELAKFIKNKFSTI